MVELTVPELYKYMQFVKIKSVLHWKKTWRFNRGKHLIKKVNIYAAYSFLATIAITKDFLVNCQATVLIKIGLHWMYLRQFIYRMLIQVNIFVFDYDQFYC